MILGAIINPMSFLPYATAAATFIVVILARYDDFRKIAEQGYQKVLNYVQGRENNQIKDMMMNMGSGQQGEISEDQYIKFMNSA